MRQREFKKYPHQIIMRREKIVKRLTNLEAIIACANKIVYEKKKTFWIFKYIIIKYLYHLNMISMSK